MNILELSESILRSVDPTVQLDSLTPDDIIQEAQSVALFAAQELGKEQQVFVMDADDVEQLSDRQRTQYAAQRKIALDNGLWGRGIDSEGSHYTEQNPFKAQGIICKNCSHYESGGKCEIVEGAIASDAICKFWIIPNSKIKLQSRTDAQVVKWKGLSIGITHEPGEMRFPMGVPMTARYGRIHRSWGKAEDGKAIDVYMNPEFNPSEDAPVYRIIQIDPSTGMKEESKYGIGYKTPGEFRQVHEYHAGRDRFGMIEEVDGSELDAYRQDSEYHADNCGCDTCAAKEKKRKRGRKTKPIEDEESEAVVLDADDEKDLADYLVERANQEFLAPINAWITASRNWLKQFDSVEAAQEALKKPRSLYEKLKGDRFANTLAELLILADLAGRDEVLNEDTREDSLSDRLIREDAPRPEWLRLPFAEAITFFRKKLNIPLGDYRELDDTYHQYAFSISGVTRADMLQDIRTIVDQAVADGTSYDDLYKQWNRSIGRKYGWRPGERRMYLILDTNSRQAIASGRGQQMTDPDVIRRRPLGLWRWRDSPNPRLNHQQLHNKAIPLNHPFWRKCPAGNCGFGCRCGVMSITEEYANRKGIEILKNPPDPETIAEPGFRRPLASASDKDRAQIIEEAKSRLSPDLQAIVEDEEMRRSQ